MRKLAQDPREQPVQRTGETVTDIGSIEVCWDSFGEPDAPPLMLIAGMGAQMISWDDAFCEALAARGFRVIRFDNRDAGRSSHLDHLGVPDLRWATLRSMWRMPVRAPYLLRDMASDVSGLMDALGIEKAHLVGFSMGGTIAQTMAIEHPERVLSLISIGSTTGASDLPQPAGSVVARVMRPAPKALAEYTDYYVRTWQMLRANLFPEEVARDRQRAAAIHARGLYPKGAARHVMAILASSSRRMALRGVNVPTLVIHGDRDPLVRLEAGLDTANSVPGAKMLILEGMGHSLPKALWPQIIDAIEEVQHHRG